MITKVDYQVVWGIGSGTPERLNFLGPCVSQSIREQFELHCCATKGAVTPGNFSYKLPTVTYRDNNLARNVFAVPQALQKVELDSTFRNDFIDFIAEAES